MSKELMLKTLEKLGFTEADSQVYVFLTAERSKKASEIAEALNLNRRQIYRILKKLQGTGVISTSSEYPARYSAVLFEKVLDLLIKTKMNQQQALQESKEELLATWQTITKKDTPKN